MAAKYPKIQNGHQNSIQQPNKSLIMLTGSKFKMAANTAVAKTFKPIEIVI